MRVCYKIRPISVNDVWQGRRFKTKEYKDYEEELLLKLPKLKTLTGDVVVNIVFFFQYPKRRDVDNCVKPLLDIIVKKGYIEDDRKIQMLSVEKRQGEEGFDICVQSLKD